MVLEAPLAVLGARARRHSQRVFTCSISTPTAATYHHNEQHARSLPSCRPDSALATIIDNVLNWRGRAHHKGASAASGGTGTVPRPTHRVLLSPAKEAAETAKAGAMTLQATISSGIAYFHCISSSSAEHKLSGTYGGSNTKTRQCGITCTACSAKWMQQDSEFESSQWSSYASRDTHWHGSPGFWLRSSEDKKVIWDWTLCGTTKDARATKRDEFDHTLPHGRQQDSWAYEPKDHRRFPTECQPRYRSHYTETAELPKKETRNDRHVCQRWSVRSPSNICHQSLSSDREHRVKRGGKLSHVVGEGI